MEPIALTNGLLIRQSDIQMYNNINTDLAVYITSSYKVNNPTYNKVIHYKILTSKESEDCKPQPKRPKVTFKEELNDEDKPSTRTPIDFAFALFDKDEKEHINIVPKTYKSALKSKECLDWEEAIKRELNSLNENKTWTVVDKLSIPKTTNIIRSKWVFTHKIDSAMTLLHKARLVAKGFSQQYQIDYDEIYSPVASYMSLKLILCYAASLQMYIHSMDVTTAFLYPALKEDIYMEIPEGLSGVDNKTKILKLDKCLYGLKQSPRYWNEDISNFFRSIGFTELISETCVFIRKDKDGCIIFSILTNLYLDNQNPCIQVCFG